MISFGLRGQGDSLYREMQGIQEFTDDLNAYPQGDHFIRLSLHHLEFMRDLLGERLLSDSLRNLYRTSIREEAEKVVHDSRISSDPSVYEHVLAVITYCEVMYSIGDKDKILPMYEERYGNYTPATLPASTYWMFAILWQNNMATAEDLSDWNNALKYTEYRLATPPEGGNAWPQGNPTSAKKYVLEKAVNYASKAGNTQKQTAFQSQLDVLQKEEGQ